jgi:hypothetical protein
MRTIGKIIGMILWIGAGILMFIFWLTAMSKWLGFFGTMLAFVLSPGLVIFPIVFWLVERVFPTFYFIVWGIGIVGLIIVGISTKDE